MNVEINLIESISFSSFDYRHAKNVPKSQGTIRTNPRIAYGYFSLVFRNSPPNATDDAIKTEIINDSLSYGILLTLATLIQLIAGIFAIDCFNRTALRQITRIRIKYFQSLMQQEIGWYDVAGSNNNFAVRATE